MGYDPRIGLAFLEAGLGFGGSCFPKDVKALMSMAAEAGQHPQLLQAVMDINSYRRRWVVEQLRGRLGDLAGKRIGVLGLAFKEDTDDVRESPSIDVLRLLQAEGAEVVAYDPAASENAQAVTSGVTFAFDAYEAAKGAEGLILATKWNEFKNLDLERIRGLMKRPLVIDGKNLYEPQQLLELGFEYIGVARGLPDHSGSEADRQIILQD
jgi:UDPglucose 6-dehydrogenase